MSKHLVYIHPVTVLPGDNYRLIEYEVVHRAVEFPTADLAADYVIEYNRVCAEIADLKVCQTIAVYRGVITP